VGWGKGNTFSCGAFCEAKNEIRRQRNPSSRTLRVHYGARSEGGQKFLVDTHSPTPFLFARPSGNYQKSASGFSRKKVRILFRTDSQFVKFWFPASLGASPLASANEFSSNFQTSQSFFSPEGRTQSGNFLPKSDYKFNQIKI
jgi:hypothetical protein